MTTMKGIVVNQANILFKQLQRELVDETDNLLDKNDDGNDKG